MNPSIELDNRTSLRRKRPRVYSIQPDIADDQLESDAETVTSRQTLKDLREIVRQWCVLQDDLADGFADTFMVVNAIRQVIPVVIVRSQRSTRSLHQRFIAHDGQALNTAHFDSSDTFALAALKCRCRFPDTPLIEEEIIPGNERLVACTTCSGSGQIVCAACNGAGSSVCRSCSAAGQILCNTCNGQGVVLVGGIQTQSCPSCSGRRMSTCRTCSGVGQCACTRCHRGSVHCGTCGATGKLRQQWVLITKTCTFVSHRLFCEQELLNEKDEVALDSLELRFRDWRFPEEVRPEELQAFLPDCLAGAVKRCLSELDLSSRIDEQCTGLRLQLAASYVYRVQSDHKGKQSEFLVFGCGNTVVAKSIVRRKRRWFHRLIDKFEVTDEEMDHARAVAAGSLYLNDWAGFGREFAVAGIKATVGERGYEILSDDEPETPVAHILFDYDSDSQLLIRTLIEYGVADRELLPAYLTRSQFLSIGLIGLHERMKRSVENAILVDSRPYLMTTFREYRVLLRLLLADFRNLKKNGFEIAGSENAEGSTRLLKQICDNIKLNINLILPEGRVAILRGAGEALIKFTFPHGRSQHVLLKLHWALGFLVVELKSRCRVAKSAEDVRRVLRSNLQPLPGGFVLDPSTEPPSIDLVYRMVWFEDAANYDQLVNFLHSLILRADSIESFFSVEDRF